MALIRRLVLPLVGLVVFVIAAAILLPALRTEPAKTNPVYALAVVQDGGLLAFSITFDGSHVITGDGRRTVFYTIGKDGKVERKEAGPLPPETVKELVKSATISGTILANPSGQQQEKIL